MTAIPEDVMKRAKEVHARFADSRVTDNLTDIIARAILADREARSGIAPAGVRVKALQSRVQLWMMTCFGPEISADKLERSDRFIEEALELVQSGDYPKERVLALVDYVYGRDKGEMPQEVGGVMTTLAALCLAHDIDMHEAGETELARIWTKVEEIRAKQAAKPRGSALPVAAQADCQARIMAALEGVETAPPSSHVAGNRWRVFEDTTPGYWGIELEAAGNDGDAIMCPQKIHRNTVARIVEAHNAALLLSPEPNLAMLLQSKAEGIRTEYQLANGHPCDCRTPDSALHYGRAQGLEIAADVIGAYPSPNPGSCPHD